ncbi:MAG: divalent metal cation transporter [Cytophagales bacterium]|nr:divalent metal cation transporter [Cytophagales bacterium]
MFQSEKFQNFVKTFGPGIMFAGTCIGGSHLVQSTKAGANYGFSLLLIILLANIFKYPFFEFASRYTSATGDSILEGYKRLGNWTLYLYLIITIISMFIITAAIGMVTGGLVSNLFSQFFTTPPSINIWVAGVFVIVTALLVSGKFGVLDTALKIIGLVLVVSVLFATVSVLINGRAEPIENFVAKDIYTPKGYFFLISLMGWMPIAVDMSSWHSLWTQERIKQTGYKPTLKETLLDFNIGYVITIVLAICFVTLGAYVLYGTGTELSKKSVVFANQLVTMFTSAIGGWSYYVIAIAAFATMFGTSITLIDGYCRAVERTLALLKTEVKEGETVSFHKGKYISIMLVLVAGAFLIVLGTTTFKNELGEPLVNFSNLVDIATATSFVLAPVAAILNYKIIFNKEVSQEYRPPLYLKVLAILGIAFLFGFTVFYLLQLYGKFM